MPADDRNSEIVRLAQEGVPHSEIAVRFGISRPRVSQIISRAQAQEESERVRELRKLYSRQAERADNPMVKTSAMAQATLDPRTCTCGTKGKTYDLHLPECKVQPVLDQSTALAADKERRLILAELRKEEDRELSNVNQDDMIAEAVAFLESTWNDNQRLAAENADLRNRLAAYETEGGEPIYPVDVVS